MPEGWRAAAVAALVLAPGAARADVPVVELDGVVHAVTAAHVVQAIDRADAEGAPLVVVRMNTPGGLDSSMREVMSKKVPSDAAAYIRGKAERRGRNVEMAEKAVVESKSFTEKEALELKLIALVAKDVPDLLAQLDGRAVTRFDGTKVTLKLAGEKTVDVRMDWRQAILS